MTWTVVVEDAFCSSVSFNEFELLFVSSRPLINLAQQCSQTSSITTEVNHKIDNIQAVLQCVSCWAWRRVEVEMDVRCQKGKRRRVGRLLVKWGPGWICWSREGKMLAKTQAGDRGKGMDVKHIR
jgi:hypothetical protein